MLRLRLALRPLALLLAASQLVACGGVQEDTLHERLAPVERQTEELQTDQQALLQRIDASEAEMQRLRAELDALRPQPKVKAGKGGTPAAKASASGTQKPSGMAVPPPRVVTPAEAAADDRRLLAAATPSAPAGPSTVAAPAATTPAAAAPSVVPVAPISAGTLPVNAPPSAVVAAPTGRPANEQAAYKQALATYEQGRFAEAEELFNQYLQTWPTGKFAPNALYWKGECLYTKGRNADAVFLFKDVLTRFPKHSKAPDALLKSIMSFKRLGDTDNARLHFSVLQEDYPASPALKRARELGLDR